MARRGKAAGARPSPPAGRGGFRKGLAALLAAAALLPLSPALAEIVQAPRTRGEVTLTVPPDRPDPVTFTLQGWVCVEGDLDRALADLRRTLEKTPWGARPGLLGIDLEQALQRLTSVRIRRNPSVSVPAPGRKIEKPCFDAESWALVRSGFERLISETPYRGQERIVSPSGPGGKILPDRQGRRWLLPETAGETAETVASLPDGKLVTGGAPIGRAPALATGPAPAPGTPVIGRDGSLAGHVRRDPAGIAWFTPLGAEGAPPATPQQVEILPGGHVVWGTVRIGTLGSPPPREPPQATAARDDPLARPVYGRDGRQVGRLLTAPDGSRYLAPTAPEGALPGEPQKVEVFADGTIMWMGRAIGNLNREKAMARSARPGGAPETPATASPPATTQSPPPRATEQAAGEKETTENPAPVDAEQAALARIRALEKALATERERIAALRREKNRIHARILRLLRNRELSEWESIDRQVEEASARWEALRRRQAGHFDRMDHLREALSKARKALPEARKKARQQRREKRLSRFVAKLHDNRPGGPVSPVTGLIANLEKALGPAAVDRLVASFEQSGADASPLGFLDHLGKWLEENAAGNSALGAALRRDRLRILTRILRDPGRARLWGVKASEIGELRRRAIAGLEREIGRRVGAARGREGLQAAFDALELRLLRLNLARGNDRLAREADFRRALAAVEERLGKSAPADAAAADGFWAEQVERMRWLIVQAGMAESPFGRRISALIASSVARAQQARANAASVPGEKTAALQLAAARAFLLGGNRVEALSAARLAARDGDDETRLNARLLQLVILNDLRQRQRLLSAAEKRALSLLGPGADSRERIENAQNALLRRIIADPSSPEGAVLKAALALWQSGDERARREGAGQLDRLLAGYRERDEPPPPLLAAWEVLGKWPEKAVKPSARADLLKKLVKERKTLIALSRLVFVADMKPARRRDLAHAIESLFWRELRSEKDEAARNALIRAAIAHYRDYAAHLLQTDPDFLAGGIDGASSSEAERIGSNIRYWIERLPERERASYSGVAAFVRAASASVAERRAAARRIAGGRIGRSDDIDQLLRFAFEQFRKGNIANAAKVFERALKLSREQGDTGRTLALVDSMRRLVNRQRESDMPVLLGARFNGDGTGVAWLKAISKMSPADRRRLLRLSDPERKALEAFSATLNREYDRLVSEALDRQVEIIVLKAVNALAKLPANATGEQARELDRERQLQLAALKRYRRLMRRKIEAAAGSKGLSRGALDGRLAEMNRRIRAQERRIDGLKSRSERATEAGAGIRKTLLVELAALNLLRAERDAIEDILMDRYPLTNGPRNRRAQLVRDIFDRINGRPDRPNERLRKNGIMQELFTDEDDTGWTGMVLRDRLRYLRARRRAVVMEDRDRDPSDSVRVYRRELEREQKYWRDEGKRLSYGPFDLGRDQRAFAEKLERDARFGETPTLIDQLINEARRADPQKFFALLAALQSADLDKGLASYNKYLDTPWYRLGLSQAYYLASGYTGWGSRWDYNEVLKRFGAQMNDVAAFNAALLSASRLDIGKLKARNRKAYDLLKGRGFIRGGKYVLPRGFAFGAGTVLDKASERTMLDDLVNVQSVGEALITIVVPGRLSFAATEYVASRWIALNALGRLGVEAAFFTGYSRAGALMLDPATGLDREYWTLNSWLRDYAHNLAVMGGLQVSGRAAGRIGASLRDGAPLRYGAGDIMNMPISQLREVTGREWRWFLFGGSGKIGMEAATLQAIDSLFNGSGVDSEGLLRNLVFLAEIKAVGLPFNKVLNAAIGTAPASRAATEKRPGPAETRRVMDILLKKYNGDWQQLVDAFKAGKVSESAMRELTQLRKAIVDGLANEVVLEIYGPDRMAREKLWDAVGSVNLTSDYDLSFKGEKAELAVLLFNERFRSNWGKTLGIGGVESAGRLDTNVYTYPRYREYFGNEKDVLSQEAAAQLGVRRYASDAEWAAHRQRVLDALKGAEKAQMRNILDRVEQSYAQALRAMERLSGGGGENARTFAANKLYAEALKRIMRLRELYAKAGTEAERAQIAQQIRDIQARALFYASEAYLTEAAINHVVFNTQKAGRKITEKSLLSGKVEALDLPMSGNMARQSLLEQFGYLLHQYAHYPGYRENPKKAVKLSGKLSKYFLRLLDAAHIAGVGLDRIKPLVKLTVKVEKNRGNTDKLAEILPGEKAAEYARDVRAASEWLAAEIYRKAPVSITRPARQPPPVTAPKPISNIPVGAGDASRARPPAANSPRAAGPGPQPGPDGRRAVIDDDGGQSGWIYRDATGQAWYQPLGVPGAMPPPPRKVELLKGGTVVSPHRSLGRAVPVGGKAAGGGASGGAASAPSAGNQPPAQSPAQPPAQPPNKRAPKTKGGTDAGFDPSPEPSLRPAEPAGRPVIGKDGGIVGRVETDPTGQKWLRPEAPAGVLLTPPQKVEVAPDGTVTLGYRKLGVLGPESPAKAAPEPAPKAPAGRVVRGADGSVVGRLETDPTGQTWFAPDVPPGILASPPRKVALLGDGSVILGGRVIGRAGGAERAGAGGPPRLPAGVSIELVVKIDRNDRPAPADPPRTALQAPGATAPGGMPGGTPESPAPGAETASPSLGFEGLWQGWRGAVVRNLREGDLIRGVVELAPPSLLAAGWKPGDIFYEGVATGDRLTGTAYIPILGIPACAGKRLEAAFEARLVEQGQAILSRVENMGVDDSCNFSPVGSWTDFIRASRIAETPGQAGNAPGQPESPPPVPVPGLAVLPPVSPPPPPVRIPVMPGMPLQPGSGMEALPGILAAIAGSGMLTNPPEGAGPADRQAIARLRQTVEQLQQEPCPACARYGFELQQAVAAYQFALSQSLLERQLRASLRRALSGTGQADAGAAETGEQGIGEKWMLKQRRDALNAVTDAILTCRKKAACE